MKLINVALEDENATDAPAVDLDANSAEDAAEAVENQESTEPAKVLQVANYKEELAKLRAANGEEANPVDAGSTDEDPPADEGGEEAEGDAPPDTDLDAEGGGEPTVEEDDAANGEDGAEEASDEPTEEEVATEAYIQNGIAECQVALEGMQVISQLHDTVVRQSQLGGVSKHTAKIVTEALHYYGSKVGVDANTLTLPALEDFGGYTSGVKASRNLVVGMENILERVWEAIKRFFKSIWNWITDLLTSKKKNDTVAEPQSNPTQTKAIKELKELLEKAVGENERIERLRDKDKKAYDATTDRENKAKKVAADRDLSLNISRRIFSTNDNGTLGELINNSGRILQVSQSFTKVANKIKDISEVVAGASVANKTLTVKDFILNKNVINVSSFDTKDASDNPYTVKAETGEIVGGWGVYFVYASSGIKELNSKEYIKALGHLSKQGFGFTKPKPNGSYPNSIPKLKESELMEATKVITNLEAIYDEQNNLSKFLEVVNAFAKDVATNQAPKIDGTNAELVNNIQAQLQFVGSISTISAASLVQSTKQINAFKNGFRDYLSNFIS